ncbi:MAG: isochorismatase hydrolase [Anaerolineaceae bacterium]|nr:MAG: isochorismatase hydrolase [Anaerolineaceae bacterium]
MKKELYFSSATIAAASKEMLASVAVVRRRSGLPRFEPDRAALLVLDMQAYFLGESSHAYIPSAAAIIPNLQALIRAFAARGRPVIFTRHTNTPADAGRMARWWNDLLAPDSPASAIIPELDTTQGMVIEKRQYDAFYQTDLEQILRGRAVGQVVVTGVMTHLCCETTARSAFMSGFDVFFVIDGTATYTEAFHRASALNLAHGFAVPALAEEILAGFENEQS